MPPAKRKPSEALKDDATGSYREVDLTGAPVLRPVATLRPAEKIPLIALGESVSAETDVEDLRIDVAYEVIARIDAALEGVAVDPEKYVAWVRSESVTEEDIVALFARYVNGLGDSKRSAN